MTVQTFVMLLTVFSTVTSLITEALKKFLDSLKYTYPSNLVVLISALLTGGIGTTIFYVLNGTEFTFENIVYIAVMIVANWIGSMVGYDKVSQLIQQINGK